MNKGSTIYLQTVGNSLVKTYSKILYSVTGGQSMQSKVSIWLDTIFLRHHISSHFDWYANWNGLIAEGSAETMWSITRLLKHFIILGVRTRGRSEHSFNPVYSGMTDMVKMAS